MPTDENSSRRRDREESDAPFPYMRWAKQHLNASWGPANLGMSGVTPPGAADRERLGLPPSFEVGAPNRALKAAIAARHDCNADQVHLTAGTSHANFIACLALARGGRIAVEAPAYGALPGVPDALGTPADRFARDPERGFRIDPSSLAAAARADTRLFVVTDLHNPSGMRLDTADLDLLIETAAACDAFVLVDEVYAALDPERRPTAARRDARVVTTNSLTKAHGLGELRTGWVLGDPEVIRQIEEWDDLVHPEQPPLVLAAASAYLPHAEERLGPVRAEAAARAGQVDHWVQATPGVSWSKPHGGITGLLQLAPGLDGDAVAAALHERHGVRAVPGSFFQMPGWLRISYLLPKDDLARALHALAAVLETSAGEPA